MMPAAPSSPVYTYDDEIISIDNPLLTDIDSLGFDLPRETLKSGTPTESLNGKGIKVIKNPLIDNQQYEWIQPVNKKIWEENTDL